MATQTYYEILEVTVSATQAEIETAIENQYNQWRRLVTHHDGSVVTQANQALQALEQIRATLTDPQKRKAYNEGIGLGDVVSGLGDPEALLQQTGLPSVPSPTSARKQTRDIQRLDAWECPKCSSANPTGTAFCQQCRRP